MATARRDVLVTGLEYRKAEASFVSASGLRCVPAPDDEAGLAAAIRDARARFAIVGARAYTGPLYDALAPGGLIARFGVGHDGIDKAKATASGLLCTNTPGVLEQSVAEHTMLLVAAAARALVAMATSMAQQQWRQAMGVELHGRTIAIVGLGGIGRAVARIASLGFGMRVVGCTRPDAPPPAAIAHVDVVTNDFAAAVRGADFVSLHLSATPATRHWIDRDRLAAIGAYAWLINTARGSLVDEAALHDALAGGRLAGAALDVFDREPYAPEPGGRDLRALPNVILTPHVGSNTAEANRRMAERALQNVARAAARDYARLDLLNPAVLADPRIG